MDLIAFRQSIERLQSVRWSARQKRLNALSLILRGKQYEHIPNSFSKERDGDGLTGKRILLDKRRPAVQLKLPKQLVREQCGLIFGEDHRPMVLVKPDEDDQDGGDKQKTPPKPITPNAPAKPQRSELPESDPTNEWIAAFVHDTRMWAVLMDGLWKGSVGSCAIVLRVLGKTRSEPDPDDETKTLTVDDGAGRYYFEVWRGEECTPKFHPAIPDELTEIDRRYFIGEDALKAQGYNVEALKEKYKDTAGQKRRNAYVGQSWACRLTLNATEEIWYVPVPRHIYEAKDWKDSAWARDEDRSFAHKLDEVPAYWELPLPIDSDELFPDGACLFEDVIDPEFRANRTISQAGRALDYTGDPQMARLLGDAKSGKVAATEFGKSVAVGGSASDILEGDAKFVEITGQGLEIAIDTYLAAVADYAKASGAMSRITPDSKTGAQPDLSSVAMKLLNFSQLVLSGILRETAAEWPGDRLLRLAMRMAEKVDVELPSLKDKSIVPDQTARFEWQWPAYYEPHGQEKLFEIQAIDEAKKGGLISQETAVANTAPMFDVTDTAAERSKIEDDQERSMGNEIANTAAMAEVNAKFGPQTGPGKGKNPGANQR